jgi:crotonobetainyl-CoA:carnitine CoA-transferase CaiB-like acyl-CoA transferase
MRGALSGIKGVEAASYVTGPFASQLLADMGGGSYQNRRAQARRSCSRLGRTKLFGDILQFEPQQANDRPPPVLGEHTEEILTSLGYDGAAIATLRDHGVI